jgi:hypothetical protein
MSSRPVLFLRILSGLIIALLPNSFKSSPQKVVEEAELGYYEYTMNKSKRVAMVKHRRKAKKLEAKRKTKTTPA